jgi:peptidyl-prolyl cis-trans isomerase C
VERVEREKASPADVIVRVNDAVLTTEDVDDMLPEGERMPFTPEEKTALIDRWVEMELLHQEALRRGLRNDPKVRARLESLEREFLADHLAFLELRDRIAVSEEEVEEYFERHRDEYLYEYRVSHILLNTYEEAQAARELIRTKGFAWVANRYSVDPVARRGGDLGYLTKGNMIPAFETVVFDMQPGEISDIVRSEFGYHIIMLVGVREASVKVELDDVRERLMNELVMQRREAAYHDLVERLRAAADIEYPGLDRFVPAPAVLDTAFTDTSGVDTTDYGEETP